MDAISALPALQLAFPKDVMEAARLLALFFGESKRDSSETTRMGRSKHPAWEYFARLKSNAVCLLCSATVKSACSTNLSRHIMKHHPSTALQMRKAWLASRVASTVGGVSSSSSAPIAAAVTSADSKMNCDPTDPTYPLLVNPYSATAMMGQTALSQPLLTVGLGDLTSSWLPYQDLRGLDGTATYDADLTLGCPDLSATPKYETAKFESSLKYDYPGTDLTLRLPEKSSYEDTPRLYHKEEIKTDDDDPDKCDDKNGGESTPAKRGRPTENPCWNYFFRLDDQNVRCKLCSKVVKSACATNMTKHLERHHQHDYQHLIVQIRQYRSSKGPMIPSGAELSHLVSTNGYVKAETYPDIYSTPTATATTDNDLAGYSQAYERTVGGDEWNRHEKWLQIQDAWNRQSWGQWTHTTPQPMETATAPVEHSTPGVIIVPSSQSWASTSSSTPGTGEKPYMKRNRKTEHPVWEYFKRTQDGNAMCAICTGVVKSPCSSNFMRHLMRHHSTEYNNVYVKWVQKRGPGGMPK